MTARKAKYLFFIFVIALSPFVQADQRELKTEEGVKVDAVLLLDASGSMLKTDPQRLRDEGARLFIQFLKPGDRVALMQFDKEPQLVRPFTDYSPEVIPAIGVDLTRTTTEGAFTDLLSGIKSASELLQREGRPDASGMIILLSDGKMEPDPTHGTAFGRTEELLNNLLPDLKSKSIKVHTLSFSEQADKQLLSEIAVATEGVNWFTPTSDKIHESFAGLFLAVKKPQVVPLTGKGFTIDTDVQEATFYVNKEESADLIIKAPSGKDIKSDTTDEQVKWYKGQKFDVVTVLNPEPGAWRVSGLASADSFATLLTNLKLVSDWPNVVIAGDPTLLQARLNEGEKPVILPAMSGATRYGFQVIPTDRVSAPIIEEILYDDGTHGDKIAEDGIFSHKINIEEAGEYKIWVVAKGPTFDRRQQIPFRVKPPLVSIQIVESEHKAPEVIKHESMNETSHNEAAQKEGEHGAEHHEAEAHGEGEKENAGEAHSTAEHSSAVDVIQVKLSNEAILMKDISVKLFAIDEDRKKFGIPLERSLEERIYEVPAAKLPHEGVFDLQAMLVAESKKRGNVKEESKVLRYKRSKIEGGEEPVVEMVVEKKAELPPSPIPFAFLVMLANGGIGFLIVSQLKKMQKKATFVLPEFISAEPAIAVLAGLTERIELADIAFDDPILQNEVIIPGSITGATAAPAPQQTPPPQAETSAEGDAAAAQAAPPAEAAPAEEPTPPESQEDPGQEGGGQ